MDCLFCQIIRKQIPSKIVLETTSVLVIHDINPKAKVHVLAIPKQHLVTLQDITEQNQSVIGELCLAIKTVTTQLGIADSGYKVVINNGRNGGQIVPHLHMHVLGGERVQGIT
ncbi:MAG: histidine triad nucleotide-binding protein [Patescibacteria group bacterium]|jgi:histidine triad (HIT) family protein